MTATSVSNRSAGRLSDMLANTRRIGGITGIAYVVLFIIGILLQGDTPMADDDIESVREFFADSDKTNMYLVGDWLIGIAFIFLFLPFLSSLRSVLGVADPSGGMWARLAFAGGILVLAAGLAGSLAWGSLALLPVTDIDDSTLLFANRINHYGFGSGLPLTLAALIVPASLVVVASGVFWRWLGYAGLIVALANVVGALWVIEGDQETFIGLFSLIGFAGYGLWMLATSIALLMSAEDDATV